MNRFTTAARAITLASTVSLAACQGGLESTSRAPLDTENQQASYGIGFQVGTSLLPGADSILVEQLVRGLRDGIEQRDPAIDRADLEAVVQRFTMMIQQQQMQRRSAEGEQNRQQGEEFLAGNANKEGVQTTASGLQYEVLREGDGARPGPQDRVTINYRGTLLDGTQFDSSYDRGQPATFSVGGVIPGFAEGLQLMTVGSQYRFWIPGDLAYGEAGGGDQIGPNATLVFEVELLEIAE